MIGLVLSVVTIHAKRLLYVAAMDLDDPSSFLSESNVLRTRPIDRREERALLTKKKAQAFFEGLITVLGGNTLLHASFLQDAQQAGISWVRPNGGDGSR